MSGGPERERHWVGELKALAAASPLPVIDLAVGQPDGPPPAEALQAVSEGAAESFAYPDPLGSARLRAAAAEWLGARYGVPLEPTQVVFSHGAKLAVALAPLAYTEPGDVVVVPTPGYPTYAQAVRLLGRTVRWLVLRPEAGYQASEEEQEAAFEGARMAFLCDPGNPTGAVGGRPAFEQALRVAQRTRTVLVHDAAYAELRHDGQRDSLLALPGASEWAVELHSCSKTFHLAGFRIGFVASTGALLEPLAAVLALCDTGPSRSAQQAAEAALRRAPDFGRERAARDRRRTQHMAEGLRRLGARVAEPQAAFYVWFRPPEAALARDLGWAAVVEQAGVACAPGDAFGPAGEGWIRFACIRSEGELEEVLARLEQLWG